MTRIRMISAITMMIFGFICCHKEDNNGYQSHGKITGPDIRMCACCGGWYIEIDSTTYEFDSLPDKTINLQKDTFPIFVKLNWQLSGKIACPSKRIIIQKIAKEKE
jgi:hypothetical protein